MNKLVSKFGKDKRWVNWKYKTVKGKKTKIPYSISGHPASSTDSFTWSTYEDAINASKNVGIIFRPDRRLLGIDIDHCLNGKAIVHEQKEQIASLILEADTYTEISPSGEGLHLFLEIEDDSGLVLQGNKNKPYELYTSDRYFTFTGNVYGEEREVRTVTKQEAIEILSIVGYPWKEKPATTSDTQQQKHSSHTLSDDQVVEKMFSSKNGDKIKDLYNGSLADHKDDASSADMALLSHLAFWTGKNASQMERLWLISPLGKREKTQERKDYRDRTVNAAIASCKTVYETPQIKMEREHPDLDLIYVTTKSGVVYLQNTENMCRILRSHPNFSGRFRYDAFKCTYQIKPTKTNEWRTIEDNDAVNIQTAISIHFPEYFGRVGKEMVYDAMVKVAKENEFDSAVDFITSIKWDGTKRLDNWLQHTYGVADDVYHRAVASNWLKGLVKRICEPGCKFDYVLVLEGEQGARKSTSLSILGSDWHVETTMSTDSKDFFMQFQGKAIIEFSEGETLSRTEVKRMKAIITMQVDKYRPPYERTSQDFPRRCVFAMTTNQEQYLKDETGNRRWLPIRVEKKQADTEWLKENRNQLLAEAYHRVMVLKETTYEFPEEETLAQQQARQIEDPNTDRIVEWYYKKVSPFEKEEGITIDRVFTEVLCSGMRAGRNITKWEEMSIANVLGKALQLTNKRVVRNGIRCTRWFDEKNLSETVELSAIEKEVRDFNF